MSVFNSGISLLLIGGTLLSASISYRKDFGIDIYSSVYGPFEAFDNDIDIDVLISNQGKKTTERFFVNDSDGNLLAELSPKYIKEKEKEKILTYHIPLSGFFNKNGFQVKLSSYMISSEGQTHLATASVCNVIPRRSINIKADRFYNQLLEIKDTFLCFNENFDNVEILDFTEQNYYFKDEHDAYLTLNDINFKFHSPKEVTYKNANLVIFDPENNFVSLNKDENDKTYIPLKIIANGDYINFDFLTTFFVEPTLNVISLNAKEGYLVCSYFYFPKNHGSLFSETTFSIEIEEFGSNKCNVTIPLEKYASGNIFGKCNSSDYCVKGGIHA